MKPAIPATFVIAVFSIFVCDLFAERGGKSFKNYDNDPWLDKALSHDPEYAFEEKMKSQSEAEKYYLAYLKREDIPSFQRAKVYCQLGVIFTTSASKKRGEKRDYQKAEKYYKKVLELEPERVGRATIRARTMLCSLRELPLKERVTRGLDAYEWISAIEIDEDKLKSRLLPNRPNEEKPDGLVLRSLMNSLPKTDRMVARNTVNNASFLPNSEQALAEIIKRFPDKLIATVAREELNKRADKVADAAIDSLVQEQPLKKTDTQSPTVGKIEVSPAHSEPNKPETGKQEAQAISADAAASDEQADSRQSMLLPVAAVSVGVLAAGVLIVAVRKRGKPL